jgi:hypothetical protein
MKFSFDVGEKEKHNIYFHWNQLWGSLRISVDGKTIERRFFQIASPNEPAQKNDSSSDDIWVIHGKRIKLVDRWEFTVGGAERHTILIIKTRKK